MGSSSKVNVLLVDDHPAKLLSYEVILKELGENLLKAGSAREALEILLKTEVAVVLVDVCMPELDGFELARMLREHPRFAETAIIFISAIHLSELDLLRGYKSGAVDYVPVPVVPEILQAKVKVFVELYRKTRDLAYLNDDLERRVAERTAELGKSEERYRTVVEGSLEGIGIDQDGRVVYANAALAAMFGLDDVEALIGRETASLGLQQGFSLFAEHLQQVTLGDADGKARGALTGWQGTRRDGAEIWVNITSHRIDWNGRPAAVTFFSDVTKSRQAQERQRLLMAELDHRVKNILANVRAMVRLTGARATSTQGFIDALDGRIQAMSTAHGLLRRGDWEGANLIDLVTEALAPFRSAAGRNLLLEGTTVRVNPRIAQSLALLLHELATNAVKHGSLSVAGGKVRVGWTRIADAAQRLRLSWAETGGPAVQEPDKKGFGLALLKAGVADIGGDVDLAFSAEGFKCALDVPFEAWDDAVRQDPAAAERAADAADPPPADGADGARILVVEDEPLIALQVQSDLESEGHSVVGPAATLAHGVALAGTSGIDAALLDLSLGRDTSIPIAEQLLARKIPFAFASGHSDSGSLPEHLRSVPRLIKPYSARDIQHMMQRLLALRA